MNQWPVLFVTLKDVNGIDFQDAYGMLQQVISDICKEHYYLMASDKVDPEDREAFSRLHTRKSDISEVKNAISILLRMMHNHYGKEVILLMDEYDVPLAKASDNGYYDEMLLAGGVIQEHIREDLTYDIAHSSEDNLWSILYLTGYLTQVLPEELPEGMSPQEGKTSLRIPNEEVKFVFKDTVQAWFEEKFKAQDRSGFFEEWWNGEDEKLTEEVTNILFDTISYFDYKEDFYHAFVAGMFSGAGYSVRSNSEQGKGRADITIRERRHRRAIVIEVKWPGKKKNATLESECQEALDQIVKMQYARNLQIEGYRTVICYGAAFLGKDCLIRKAEI